jgi:Flp pilus assembly pilin Flp
MGKNYGERMKKLLHLLRDESGATAIEYGLIVCLIVIGIVASIANIGSNFVTGPMTQVGSHLTR